MEPKLRPEIAFDHTANGHPATCGIPTPPKRSLLASTLSYECQCSQGVSGEPALKPYVG
jgi:hypothetical protein